MKESGLYKYSTGDISASDAAYEIQALKIPGYSNPSVSEVMLWSRAVGYGLIPDLQTEEEDEADAERIFKKCKNPTSSRWSMLRLRVNGATDGDRTHDILDHNQALYR